MRMTMRRRKPKMRINNVVVYKKEIMVGMRVMKKWSRLLLSFLCCEAFVC